MIKCNKCSNPAITFIRYSGLHLCKEHFIEFFERRVKKEVRKYKIKGKIAVAISGGKDSIVAMHMLKKIFKNSKVESKVEIEAITVDEGIKGYRPASIEIAKKNCRHLNIKHHIITFKDTIGFTMDEIINEKDEKTPCAYCGVFRRYCLNLKAKEISAKFLATGLNLNDTAQSILMNFIRNDLEKLARLGPHYKVQKGLIPRIQPLRVIPEKESYLYAILIGIEIHDGICPYAERAQRNLYREIINKLEYKNPGAMHAILNSYDEIKDLLISKFPSAELNKCVDCKEPTINIRCKTCELKLKIKAKIKNF